MMRVRVLSASLGKPQTHPSFRASASRTPIVQSRAHLCPILAAVGWHRMNRVRVSVPVVRVASGLMGLLATLPTTAQTPADGPARLAPVVVTATRTEQSTFDVPASIDRIGGDFI